MESVDIFDQPFMKELFEDMAPNYWVNDFCSLGLANHWRRLAVRAIRMQPGAGVCDRATEAVRCGGGAYLPKLWIG